MFEIFVYTTYESILMVLVHIATSRTNIKVAYKHVMICDCSKLGESKFLIKRFIQTNINNTTVKFFFTEIHFKVVYDL